MGSNFVRYKADKAEIIVVDALKYGSNENNLKDFDMALRITDYGLRITGMRNQNGNFHVYNGSQITDYASRITQMRNQNG